MRKLMILVSLGLAGCINSTEPCPSDEDADRAAQAYRACIMTYQQGDGGYDCGSRAWKTHCLKPRGSLRPWP